jgi:toxin CcdB
MPQFAVYRNKNPATKAAVPYLLNIQSELLDELDTRTVIPLYPLAAMKGKSLKTLTPMFEIEGKPYLLMTPQLAGIGKKQLGVQAADLSHARTEIVAAIDLLISGI